jgi:hypothetical protein
MPKTSPSPKAPDFRLSLNPPQSAAYRLLAPGHTVAIPWGRGIGKSWFQRVVCYLLAAQWDGRMRPTVDVRGAGLSAPEGPGIRIVFLMPTLAQFKKVHLPYLPNELEERWAFLRGHLHKSEFKVTYPGGSWIQVVSAEAAQGSRGIRCDVVVGDEVDDIDPEVLEAISLAWFTEPHSLRIMLLGGTPKRGRYGLLWKAHNDWPQHPALRERHHSVHATCYDAPRQVDRRYIDTEIRPKVTPAVWRREYLCDFDSGEGLVYSMFAAPFHVREPDYGVDWNEILVGVDHGTADPGVYLVCGVIGNGKDAIIHALEEVYETDRDTTWWMDQAEDIARRYRKYRQRWYADPSRPDRIMDIRRRVRERVPELGERFSITAGENEIEAGVDAVADRICTREREDGTVHARFYVSRACKNTIREFGLYRRKRDPRNPERVLDDILDKDNHAMDAARYLTFTRFGGPDRRRHMLPHDNSAQRVR